MARDNDYSFGATWYPRKRGVWFGPNGTAVKQPKMEPDGRVQVGYCMMPSWEKGVDGWYSNNEPTKSKSQTE
jgi:hypothetical protein